MTLIQRRSITTAEAETGQTPRPLPERIRNRDSRQHGGQRYDRPPHRVKHGIHRRHDPGRQKQPEHRRAADRQGIGFAFDDPSQDFRRRYASAQHDHGQTEDGFQRHRDTPQKHDDERDRDQDRTGCERSVIRQIKARPLAVRTP
jgi:hypothetical protein